MRRSEQALGIWPIRALWLLLPLIAGPVLGDAVDDASRPVQVVASVGLWGLWAGTLLATLLPRPVSLTVVRIVAPTGFAAIALAVASGGGTTWWQVASLCWGTLTVGSAFHPATGQASINGSSYGDELRVPLRVPGVLVLGPIPATWLIVVTGAVSGPMLLAVGQWIVGGVTLAFGLPAALWGVRVLHRLARRWAVFVPGGLVLHDPLTLADPILLRRGILVSLGPASADTTAMDLTAGALGLAIEARLSRPVSLVLARPGRTRVAPPSEAVSTDALLFTPTRPGAFLAAARSRRLGRAAPLRRPG